MKRRKKHRKDKKVEPDVLDEDDLELIKEANQEKDGSPKKKFKRL